MSNTASSGPSGLVFNIQRYSIHDGPGIRTAVFLKGCPLRCEWCCNPESQDARPQLAFIADKCIDCGRCIALCPHGAVTGEPGGPVTDWAVCARECLAAELDAFPCAAKCFGKARDRIGVRMGIEEVMAEVMKDARIYAESGGGLTVSGGEPLAQARFVAALVRAAKGEWLHVAIETCGHAPWKAFEEVLEFVDFVFLDIKFLDDERHRKFTGQGNALILENAGRIDDFMRRKGGTVVVRTPVVPGIVEPRDVEQIGSFIRARMPGTAAFELMPYHRLGRGKYRDIGREYSLAGASPPSEEEMRPFREAVAAKDLAASYA
jgi:pyruvate formate lyase activating enzyme